MESGAIPDGKISASSVDYTANQGRLNFQKTGNQSGAWTADVSDGNQWLQVELESYHTKVTGVATQGRNGHLHWVKKYKLQYSYNGVNFQYYREYGTFSDKVRYV